MNETVVAPQTEQELEQAIAAEPAVLAVGNRTKPTLSSGTRATLVSLRCLSGILQYEPSEFTFTTRAGTPISEIASALQEKQQYLPFDPMLADSGATIGGTVAAGLSGPGRFRFGGIRDFLLGVRMISGAGDVIRAGGKVVKNAAGFDIPKFMIGSMGCFGVLTELTFKVFPAPVATKTLAIDCQSHQQAVDRISVAASSRWESDAIDYRPADQAVYLRLAGPPQTSESVAAEIRETWGDQVRTVDDADTFWRSVCELNWSADATVAVKVPTTSASFLRLTDAIETQTMHLSAAANVIWLLLDDPDQLAPIDSLLRQLEMPGLVVRGSVDKSRIGHWPDSEMQRAVKTAMDPDAKFPAPL